MDTKGLFDRAKRRYLLYCLYLYSNPVRLSDVAYQVTVWDTTEQIDDLGKERHRTYMALYHDHLPELTERGVVVYDQDDDVVELGPEGEEMRDRIEESLTSEIDALLAAEHSTFGEGVPESISDELYRVLAEPTRRQMLAHLVDRRRTSLEEMVTVLVGWQATTDSAVAPSDRDRIRRTLYHVHLPKLEEAGLVDFDPGSREIRLLSLNGPVREAIRAAVRYHRSSLTSQARPDSDDDFGGL